MQAKTIKQKCYYPYWQLLELVLVATVWVWGIVEAATGLMQVLGLRISGHSLFALTGHFRNPGPYGGFIACIMAVAAAWLLKSHGESGTALSGFARIERWMKIPAGITLGMGFLVLPASMSRAGWLALIVALAVETIRSRQIREWLRKHRWVVPVCTAAFLALLVGAFYLKQDSALGRLHIWRMECRAIMERPWTGAGPGRGLWAYGEAQESFFRAHLETVSPLVVRIAGCPEYSFNEFLGMGVEYGVPGLLLSVLLVVTAIVVLCKAGSPFAAGLTAWAVFACASYPLSVVQLQILGAGFLLVAIVSGIFTFPSRRTALLPLAASVLLMGWMCFCGKTDITSKGDFRALYSKGYALHRAGLYSESTEVLEQGARISCDPMFEDIMGKNAEALGDYSRAEALYEKAHYMVPARLYPLFRLMRLQILTGRNEEAVQTAQHILAMPVNEKNTGMVNLWNDTKVTLDSLKTELQD